MPDFDERALVADWAARNGALVGVGGYDQILLEEASRAALRAKRASRTGKLRLEAGAAAAAILCAAASCEARVSEYIAHAEFLGGGPLPPELEQIRSRWDAREQWNLLLAYCAPSYELGSSREYLALGCLFQLRDHVAHRHARLALTGTWPKKLEACVRQGTIPVRQAKGADWTSAVFVHEVATWAHAVARRWLRIADDLAPLRC